MDLEFPEGVAVLGGAGGAVHADVAAGAGDVEGLVAAGAGGGGVDGCPVGVVGGHLDLERGGVGGFPVEADLADALGRAEVDFEPLRVGERRRPAGAGVAVGGVRRGGARVLGRGGGGGLVQRHVRRPAGPAAASASAAAAARGQRPLLVGGT